VAMAEELSLVLVGFGSVNRAFCRLLARDAQCLEQGLGLHIRIRAIVARHGAWEADTTFPPEVAAKLADSVASGLARLDDSSSVPIEGITVFVTPTAETIQQIIRRTPVTGKGCLVEAIDVDYDAGEPATTFISEALTHGMHAVSANKGPVVHHRARLLADAKTKGVRYLHESAVMDGVPIFSSWAAGFQPGGARLLRFRGVLNSTTSLILSGMEKGQTMSEALSEAQKLGIAEADPKGDLSGMDAAVKVVALCAAFQLGEPVVQLKEVTVSGMEEVTLEQVRSMRSSGRKLRLVGGAEVSADGGRATARVMLEALAPEDPLYGLDGADTALTLYTDRLAPVTITQKGSTVEDTAFGLFADMVRACRPETCV